MTSDHPVVIDVRDVYKTYAQGPVEVHALRGVSLTIARGAFLALAGPSGSGKSTLLNLIGCLDQPTRGDVLVDGVSLSRTTMRSRSRAAAFRLERIGFVFQAYNLIPVLSAYENAEFTLLLRGVPAAERRALVVPLLERVGLAGMLDRRPHELSGGQQQRVAVVRAIAPRPAIVLADEPTANLDSNTSAELVALMDELNHEHGITFVFSSHDPIVIDRARRVIRLRDGQIDRDERRQAQDDAA